MSRGRLSFVVLDSTISGSPYLRTTHARTPFLRCVDVVDGTDIFNASTTSKVQAVGMVPSHFLWLWNHRLPIGGNSETL